MHHLVASALVMTNWCFLLILFLLTYGALQLATGQSGPEPVSSAKHCNGLSMDSRFMMWLGFCCKYFA